MLYKRLRVALIAKATGSAMLASLTTNAITHQLLQMTPCAVIAAINWMKARKPRPIRYGAQSNAKLSVGVLMTKPSPIARMPKAYPIHMIFVKNWERKLIPKEPAHSELVSADMLLVLAARMKAKAASLSLRSAIDNR
jgi:hypothetical protein